MLRPNRHTMPCKLFFQPWLPHNRGGSPSSTAITPPHMPPSTHPTVLLRVSSVIPEYPSDKCSAYPSTANHSREIHSILQGWPQPWPHFIRTPFPLHAMPHRQPGLGDVDPGSRWAQPAGKQAAFAFVCSIVPPIHQSSPKCATPRHPTVSSAFEA